jgi:pimeloyl-ACP methyl ester carboxylesterase
VNAYYRGKGPRSEAEQAIATIRQEPWFGQVFLPNSGVLPADPKRTKWYAEMDYDPLEALGRVRVPLAFFFAQTDPWVPVEESIMRVRQTTRSNPSVAIWRIPAADHLMETGRPDSGGPISAAYLKLLLEWLSQRGRNDAG